MQLEIAKCNVTSATYNGFLFPRLRDKLQDKLHRVKSDLHISRKDRKHMFANTFLKLSAYALVYTQL